MNNADTSIRHRSADGMARRELIKLTGTAAAALAVGSLSPIPHAKAQDMPNEWDKTFPKSAQVDHRKVTFRNRYGIPLVGDLYLPKNRGNRRLAAIAVGGPFGAVKEQSSGLYAQTMAEHGFATLAFDPSHTGESGGEPRNVASPDINTEDFSAAVDFLGLHPAVNRERISDAMFVGDTLFMPDYGTARADFPGGDARALYHSICRLLSLPDETRLFMCHDYKAPGRDDYRWETTVGEERRSSVHVHDGVSEAEFVAMREARDATLSAPKLLLPSIQVNVRAGRFPPAEANGVRYLRLPVRLASTLEGSMA